MTSREEAKILFTGPSPRGWHRLQLAAECLQRYAWTYEAPKSDHHPVSPPLAKGTMVHLILAQHYARLRAVQQGQDPEEFCDPVEAATLIGKLKGYDEYIASTVDTYAAYKRHWAEPDRRWTILGVEELASVKIGKYLLTGHLDIIVRDIGGRVWVVDTKTTARLTSSHKKYYSISGQFLGYELMARERYGDQLAGSLINFVQHSPPKFDRIQLEQRPNLAARFEQSVADIEESIERMQASGRDYDDWPKAMSELTCYHRYGPCNHIDKCMFGQDYSGKAGTWTWTTEG